MGNDGGSIPRRSELVRSAAAPPSSSAVKETQLEAQAHAWSTCPLSNAPLKPPVVSDSQGRLYNKDAVLEFLLPGAAGAGAADSGEVEGERERRSREDKERVLEGRVSGLRDVVEVKFHTRSDNDEQKDGNGGGSRGKGTWVCPVTDKTLGPAVKSVYLVPCGHAFSEAAVREVKGEQGCLQCGEAYEAENVIAILPLAGSAEKERLAKRSERLKGLGLTHSLKKIPGTGGKKKKRKKEALEAADAAAAAAVVVGDGNEAKANATSKPSSGVSTPNPGNGIKNAATASLTARVLAEEQEKAKRRKLDGNENLQSLFSKERKGKVRDAEFMTRGFSVRAEAGR